jgi:hypothetical protein
MSILTTPSSAFPVSLVYITVGTLIDIWTLVGLWFYPPQTNWGYFWAVGFLVTGLALLLIGLFLGPIGRAARHAELPPAEVTASVTKAEQTAAAHPPPVVAPTATASGEPVMIQPKGPIATTTPAAPQPHQ